MEKEHPYIRVFAIILVSVFALLVIAAHFRINVTLLDDAFITYRYAANLAQGAGLVYNVGERVLGTTTPGYAVLLGGIGFLTGAEFIPVASRMINLIFLLIAGAAAGLSAYRVTEKALVGALIFGVVILSPYVLLSSLAGMETPLFLALMLVGIYAVIEKHRLSAALLFGAAA